MKQVREIGKKIALPAAASLLTALLLCAVFAWFGLFPFGKGSLSWGDMNQQVIPLMMDFKDILAGKAGFFLNLQNAGGMSFFGVFFFFLSSPFTFLAAFFEKGQLYFLVNVLVLLKLALSAATASCFFRYESPRLPKALHLFCSISYALCGYGLLYYQNLVWLDVLYLFPLLMLGFVKLFREGKSAFFTVILVLTVAVNYYLSYMVFLALILCSALFLKYCVPKGKRGKLAGKIGGSALLALLLTAVVWLPSLLQCLTSARTSSGLIQTIQEGGLFPEIPTTLPMLLCSAGAVSLPFLLGFFEMTPKRKALLTSLILTLLPLLIEPVNKLWHTGSYQAFPARYGYIPLFFSLWYLADLLGSENWPHRRRNLQKKRYTAVQILSVAHLLLLGVFLLVYKFEDMTSYNSSLWLDSRSFLYLLLFSAHAALSVCLACHLLWKGRIGRNLFCGALLLVCLIQGGFHAAVFIGPSSHAPVREWNVLSAEAGIADDGLYRAKLDKKFCDVNLLGALGYPTFNHYTSLTDERFLHTVKKLGYSSYWMETSASCGTKLSDILLSNKYSLDSSLQWNPTGSGTLGYLLPGGSLPESLESKNRLELQNRLYRGLTGESQEAFQRYEPKESSGVQLDESGEKASLFLPDGYGILRYEIPVDEEETLYFDAFDKISTHLREPINSSFLVSVNGETIATDYPSQRCNGILNLGTFSHQTVVVELQVFRNVELGSFGVYGLPEDRVQKFSSALTDTRLSFQNGKLSGTVAPTESNASLFLSIPQYPGMEIHVNGKQTEPRTVLDCFIEIPLGIGEQEIELTYIPQGLFPGILLSVSGVFLSLLLGRFRGSRPVEAVGILWARAAYPLLRAAFLAVLVGIYLLPVVVWFF